MRKHQRYGEDSRHGRQEQMPFGPKRYTRSLFSTADSFHACTIGASEV